MALVEKGELTVVGMGFVAIVFTATAAVAFRQRWRISLAKLFLYDLTTLSSLARALSFLAVGALLLLGGFFYQRLSEQLEDRGPAGSSTA